MLGGVRSISYLFLIDKDGKGSLLQFDLKISRFGVSGETDGGNEF